MSAECSKCGSDLVYPAGSWPVGTCEPCDLRAALAAAEAERDAQKKAAGSLFARAERLAAERDALRTALAEVSQLCLEGHGDDLIAVTAREALACSGSGGPGVHLTADQAEAVIGTVGRLAREEFFTDREHLSPASLIQLREALALLRPVVRGGGQAETKEGT